MLGLFSRRRRQSPPARPRSFRPTLERLEARDCPSTITLTAAVGSNNVVMLSGQVTGTPSPGGLTVQLTGTANGYATTDASGNFRVTLQASGPGQESASTTDGQSNTATTMVQMATIDDFGYIEGPARTFQFVGHVTGGVEGEKVNLGGIKDLQGQSTTLDANGSFSVTVILDGLPDDNGDAWAQVVDANGVTSNMALDWVTQTQMQYPPPPTQPAPNPTPTNPTPPTQPTDS